MSLTLVTTDDPPNNVSPFRRRNPLDVAPKHRPHVGSYYGAALRDLLDAKPPTSKRDRDSQMAWLIVAMAVPAAILLAALIVSVGCSSDPTGTACTPHCVGEHSLDTCEGVVDCWIYNVPDGKPRMHCDQYTARCEQ